MSGCGTCSLPASAPASELGRLYVSVRGFAAEDGREQLCFTGGERPRRGTALVVESERGLEHAVVSNERPIVIKACQTKGARKLVRLASEADLEHRGRIEQRDRLAFRACLRAAREKSLEMKLVKAEHDWDLKRVQITYTSEARVDFRDLVRSLAAELDSRVEMRQVGVRDGTKLTGGLGPCGLTLCCSTFLHEFHPVTIKMAKNQNLSLNPAKISGQCGRLMCCLAYENEVYLEQKKERRAEPPAPPAM